MRKLALLLLLLPVLAAGCHHGIRSEIRGNGKRELQKREVARLLRSRPTEHSPSKSPVKRS